MNATAADLEAIRGRRAKERRCAGLWWPACPAVKRSTWRHAG